jgi:NAD(P)-dependent dehydrogenase (short-subunit alcohol dehydrogenase family)
MSTLKGRTGLVTGAGKGIGRAVALDLARQGVAVVLAARTLADVETVAREIADAGGVAHPKACDVRDARQVKDLFDFARGVLGPIDILVNGAGVAPSALLVKTTEEQWRAAIETNLSGAFYCMREAVPQMTERGFGRVISVASIAGKTGSPYISAYAASKHGLLGLTKCAALELADKGVTVNAVCPGYVDTPMTDAGVERMAGLSRRPAAEVRERLVNMSPQKRLMTAEEVSALVLFLCCDAARGITGQALNVDGGTVV